jgi:hypothetical protein
MYRLHNLWMILCTIYRAKYIIWTVRHHGIHKSHWDIDVTWMDITMDINICMKAFYFGSSDLTSVDELHSLFICTFVLAV